MIGSALALLLSASMVPCPAEIEPDPHLSDICDPHLDSDQAYSVTVQASMSPDPASQQVILYRSEGEWRLRIAGFRWVPGTSLVVTRRNDIAISDEDAEYIIREMDSDTLAELAQVGIMGGGNQICMDGAEADLSMARDGQFVSVRRHSCAYGRDIRNILAEFRAVALRNDPDALGMLLYLRDDG